MLSPDENRQNLLPKEPLHRHKEETAREGIFSKRSAKINQTIGSVEEHLNETKPQSNLV